MATSDFSKLIRQAQAGDTKSLSELLTNFRSYLRLLARMHVKPLLQAKFDESDIVQETCAQAAMAINQFSGANEAQFAAWLRQILANKGAWLACQFVGTQQRSIAMEQRLQDRLGQSSVVLTHLIPSPIDSPSQQAMHNERAVILAGAIEQCSPDQREVLIMHGLEGIPIPDVAKRMARNEAAVWKIWARGLQALRKISQDSE